MKVLFVTNYPAPYRVHFFNELGKKCDLTVAFEEKPEEQNNRSKNWFYTEYTNFKAVFLKELKIGITDYRNHYIVVCPSIRKVIQDGKFDYIILGGYATPTCMYAIQYMKQNKMDYWIEIDGGIIMKRNPIIRMLQTYLVSGAQGYFSPSPQSDEYLIDLGADRKKIHRYPFTSLSQNDVLEKCISESEKQKLKCSLNMREEKVVVAVGQFIHRKGFDILIKNISHLNENAAIYMIGDKVPQEYRELKNKFDVRNQIHFIDFLSQEKLKKYYQAADVFCLPTREDIWGLVINEAMANGLPIVTTDRCIAGLELVDQSNGYIVPVEDGQTLMNAINAILNQRKERTMGESSLKKIQKYTFTAMAEEHIRILK